jgi:hypothetical protein
MLTILSCYHILKLKPGATPEEIKRAFRRLAKELHPDRNPAPDAQQQFILLHEAYNTLLHYEPAKAQTQAEILYRRQQQARKKAEHYARMKYEEYLREVELYHNSPYAWVFKILYYGLFFIYLFCAMCFAAIPLVLLTYAVKWFLLSCPLWVLAYFTFGYAYQWKDEIDPLFE